MVRIVDEEDFSVKITPICPHCDKELKEIVRHKDEKGFFEGKKGYTFSCPHCRRILGFSDWSS